MLNDTRANADLLDEKKPYSWFCVQTHPKHEHIAARFLERVREIEVFNPQVRQRRSTKRGPVWFTESAFPGYIFARFNLRSDLESVRYSSGVAKVVHFSSGYPTVPEIQLIDLRKIFGAESLLVLSSQLSVGDTVRIVGGAFHDLVAVVQQVHPAKQRILALLDFLGRMTTVELDADQVSIEDSRPAARHPLVVLPSGV